MNEHYYAMILAGGGGSRLWPLSRGSKPKQMQKIGGERSMFQLTVDRLTESLPIENVYVLTTAAQSVELSAQVPEIPEENFILESKPKGTASVIGLGAVHLIRRDPDAVLAVLPSDHFIKNGRLFTELLDQAYVAAKDRHIVTIGIEPTFPSTGYGYIEEGDRLDYDFPIHSVRRFREKPDAATARAFFDSGKFWWNGGMFIWTARRILDEIGLHLPDLSAKLTAIAEAIGSDGYERCFQENWDAIMPMTIDYGVLEKARDIVFLPARGLGWNDIGSWDSLFDVLDADADGNIQLGGERLSIDSTGTLTGTDDPGKMIVTIGVKDMIVYESGNAILVCSRAEAQRVRQAVDQLKAAGKAERL